LRKNDHWVGTAGVRVEDVHVEVVVSGVIVQEEVCNLCYRVGSWTGLVGPDKRSKVGANRRPRDAKTICGSRGDNGLSA
jgi:hypothetical protein